jgi:hypothetical protein
LQSRKVSEGKPLDGVYFDEDQITITGKGIAAKEVQGEKRGACAPNPTKY